MLKTIVTAEMLKGVLDEITGLLPIVIPVMIGCNPCYDRIYSY